MPLLFGCVAAGGIVMYDGWMGPAARTWQFVLGVGMQTTFLAAFVVAGYGFRRLMASIPERDRWYAGLIWLGACGFGADWSGLHFMVGAFLAGAIMDGDWFDQKQMDSLRHHVLLDKQIISSETFTALLLMAIASTMLTVPVVTPKLKRIRGIVFRAT